MAENNRLDEVRALARELREDPRGFLEKHQAESALLEYKSGFSLDAALAGCPLVKNTRELVLNPALALRILETLAAFANTHGGLLVMGVAEASGRIVDEGQAGRCRKRFPGGPKGKAPCFESEPADSGLPAGELRVPGMNRELEASGWNWDEFQRHVLTWFATGGRSGKKEIALKPLRYPCETESGNVEKEPPVKVAPSKSLDLLIEELFPVVLKGEGKDALLAGLLVAPGSEPLHLRMEETGSRTVKYVFPVRTPGKTELEEDLSRIQAYIEKRFGRTIVRDLVEELSRRFSPKAARGVREEDLPRLLGELAEEWEEKGFPYRMAETLGARFRTHVAEGPDRFSGEERPEVLALCLMIAIHFGAAWDLWTLRNRDNPLAVSALFETFHTPYWRTRFRALYALQHLDLERAAGELARNRHQELSPATRRALASDVPGQTVAAFLRSVAQGENEHFAKKADQVLTEIAERWKDPEAGVTAPL